MSSIAITYNDTEYKDNYVWDIDHNEQRMSFTVVCDGSELLNHFNVLCNCEWITVSRIRNEISLYIKENVLKKDRSYTIMFENTAVSNSKFLFFINQLGREYSISTDITSVDFDNLLVQSDDEKEIIDIVVTTDGGKEDFELNPVMEYAITTPSSTEWKRIHYDGGLCIRKINKSLLRITNFGKCSLYPDIYYVVELKHKNDKSKTCQITINYNENHSEGGPSIS